MARRRKVRRKIRVGIIGTGGIARAAHIPGYQKVPDCEVFACCDIVKQKAREVAKQFGIPHVFTDYRQMLEMDELDAVSVCTPNYLHKDPTIAALRAGKHVLVEKPLALNAKEGQAMVDAAKEAGKQLMCGLNNRFRAEAQALKRFIDNGLLGEAYYARAQALRRRGIPGWGVFIEKDKQGGGPLIDLGVHILDLTLYLMGYPQPIAASGQTYTKFGHRDDVLGLMGQWDPKKFTVEDFGCGFIRFDNGATVYLETSFAANLEADVFNTAILGDRGGCQLSPVKMFTEQNQTLLEMTPTSLRPVKTHEVEMSLFVEAIRNDTPVPIPAEEALQVTKILDAIYQSAEKGREVKIR